MKKKYGKPSEDLSQARFGDKRLDKRLQTTVEAMSVKAEASILSGCGTRHGAKAFYALLSNSKYSQEKVIKSAQMATVERIKDSEVTEVLLPQDTTDINYNGHKKTEGLGYSSNTTKGIKVHSCLALKPDGTPLGLMTQLYETREQAKQAAPKEELKKRPTAEKESYRWLETVRKCLELVPTNVNGVVICDREGDFYELYADMVSLNTAFVIRITQDRATDKSIRSIQQLKQTTACGKVEILVPRDSRNNQPERVTTMEVAYCHVNIIKPKRTRGGMPEKLTQTLVRITEVSASRNPIEWLLATNIPVTDADSAMKIVDRYVHRWKIERFHYILKSGCQVEKIQQRTCEKIQTVIFIYSVIAAFILALTYFARLTPDATCDSFLDDSEWKILYRLVTRKATHPNQPYSLQTAVSFLGELGGFKHSPSDGDYGVKSLWKGLSKLFDAIDVLDRLMGQV